jgi:ATP-binding cassette subfamily C protein CydD
MRADGLIAPPVVAGPDPAARRRLAALLAPATRRLRAAGVAATAATAATAAAFLAVAAVAQDVLDGRVGWGRDGSWLALLAGAAAARAVLGCAAACLAVDGARAVEGRLRSALVDRVLGDRGATVGSAALATAVLDEVDRVGRYAERYEPARIAAALVPLVLLAAVFPFSRVVGVLLVVCTPLVPLNLSVVGMGTAAVARRHAEELRHLSGHFLDRLRGLATLRALGAEEVELAHVEIASRRLAHRSMAVLRVAFVSAAVLEAIVTMAIAVIAMYVGLTLLGYVHVPGLPAHMSLRTGLYLLTITPLYFQPLRALAAAYHERGEALAAADALAPLLTAGADRRPSRAPRPPAGGRVAIEVRDVDMRFPGGERPALEHVSLAVEAGEMLGIGGASGAGKSTLLRLLAGDLEPSAGSVLIDGVPAAHVSRGEVTWLGQRPYLFPGTFAENIALGRPESAAGEIVDAALAAGLGPLLDRLPAGLDTEVGEGGWGVSGGEAQRIALARTFLKRAPLLILDEPTAHLDAGSEGEIIAILLEVAAGATAVVATHSPALLAACDRAISLERGRLVESESAPRVQEVGR